MRLGEEKKLENKSYITQTIPQGFDFEAAVKQNIREINKNAAFREWGIQIDARSKLPRGKFFKTFRTHVTVLDESWRLLTL